MKLVALLRDIAGHVAPGADTDKIMNLLKLLAENRRLPYLPDIANAYDSLKAEIENRIEVTLVAASAVDDAQQAKLVDALKRRFGRDVTLTFRLDENLIGGARLQADDLVIDGSVSAGLAKLASTLTN
jgi:F-type H+-transporting ATPase subunit delta